MIKKIIISAMLLFPASLLMAQRSGNKDTLQGTFLQTVVVNGRDRNTGFHGKRYDGQARTERLLEDIPGISLISRGNYAQEPVLRGMSGGQINITIDGMHLFGACTDRMDPATSYIEPNNMKSVQAAAAPAFGCCGATIGGGINFDLRQAQTDTANKWKGSLGTGFESNAFARQLLGNLQYSAKRFAFSVDGIYRQAGDYTPGGNKQANILQYGQWTPENVFSVNSKGQINFSQYQKWNVHGNVLYRLNKYQTLSADYLQDDGKHIGYPALPMDVAFAIARTGSITHEYRNAEKNIYDWQTKIYYNDINHAMDDSQRPAAEVPVHMDMPGHSATGGAFTQMFWKAAIAQTFRAKAEAYRNRWNASMTMYPANEIPMYMLTIPDAQQSVADIDVSDEIKLGDHWRLVAGALGSYNRSSIYTAIGKAALTSVYAGNPDRTDGLYNVSLQLDYKPLPQFATSLKLARGMRSPTLKELYSIYLYNRVDNYDYIGNPAIRKETSFNGEWNFSYRENNFKATLSGFAYLFQNYIAGFVQPGYSPMTAGANGVKQYANIASAYIAGAALTADWNVSKNISFNSNTTWQKGKDGGQHYLPMMPPLKSMNTLKYSADNWHFFAEGIAAAAQNNVSAFYGETRTPDFFIMNAGADKTIYFCHNRQIIISVACNNIFNTYYYEHLDVVKLPREGRNFVVHFTYVFN